MIKISDMIDKAIQQGYSEANAQAKVCQPRRKFLSFALF